MFKMSAKIFLPAELFYIKESCNLYGEIKISDNNAVSYFVVAGLPAKFTVEDESFAADENICGHLRYLGHIRNLEEENSGNEVERDVALSFVYDTKTPNIYFPKLSVKSETARTANIFLYDVNKILQLQVKDMLVDDDMHLLYRLVENSANKFENISAYRKKFVPGGAHLIWYILLLPLELMTRIFAFLMETVFAKQTMEKMVFYEHYKEWKMYQLSGERKSNIIVDKVLGICGMLLLLFYMPNPEEYLMLAANFIVSLARTILNNLKGNPVGLKLNTHLNNFLLDCFNYHIDLWESFLNLFAPFMQQLFVILALFGSMGISYQLALLADLISVIGLHAHCFYVYTAVLYKVEVEGLQVLWKMVRGKRFNVLKNRVETHNYNNRQLYLATIFFSSLFFLFPTILVYYGVFTIVRLLIFLENFVLKQSRRYILEFPLTHVCNWFTSGFFEIEGIQLEMVKYTSGPATQLSKKDGFAMTVFNLKIRSSSLCRVFSIKSQVLQKLSANEENVFKIILRSILAGKF